MTGFTRAKFAVVFIAMVVAVPFFAANVSAQMIGEGQVDLVLPNLDDSGYFEGTIRWTPSGRWFHFCDAYPDDFLFTQNCLFSFFNFRAQVPSATVAGYAPQTGGSPPAGTFVGDFRTASFNGIAEADKICQDEANAAGLPGTYRAWLSTESYSPASDWGLAGTPKRFVRTDGLVIAESWEQLTSADPNDPSLEALTNPINRDPFGAAWGGVVWTGTRSNGTWNPDKDCDAWTNDDFGLRTDVGSTRDVNHEWTETTGFGACYYTLPLYCFQQPEDQGASDLIAFVTSGFYPLADIPLFEVAAGNGDFICLSPPSVGLCGCAYLLPDGRCGAGIAPWFATYVGEATLAAGFRSYLDLSEYIVGDFGNYGVSYTIDGDDSECGPVWDPVNNVNQTHCTGSIVFNAFLVGYSNTPAGGTPGDPTNNSVIQVDTSFYDPVNQVSVPMSVDIAYDSVSSEGDTTVTTSSSAAGDIDANFKVSFEGYDAIFFDVSFEGGEYSGPVRVCGTYPDEDKDRIVDGTYNTSVCDLRILHNSGSGFEDVTLSDGPWCPFTEDDELTVFVTSGRHPANVGIEGANEVCQTEAEAAGLDGNFWAWLSAVSGLPDDYQPDDNWAHNNWDQAYVLPDGTRVAQGWAGFAWSGSIENPIDLHADGTEVQIGNLEDTRVWTGTRYDGAGFLENCSGWTSSSNAESGMTGTILLTSQFWSNESTATCDNEYRFYCFEQWETPCHYYTTSPFEERFRCINTVTHEVCGLVDELSPFVIPVDIGNEPPTIVAVDVAPVPAALDESVTATATFCDPDVGQALIAEIDWGDGNTDQVDAVAAECNQQVTAVHTYAEPGVYTVTVAITEDQGTFDSETFEFAVIYDPSGGFVTGGGWIDSPEGAYVPDPTLAGKANFGFVSKYKKGASVPTGNTEFQFKVADLNFKSTSYDWLVIAGDNARYKGEGTINGEGDYKFMLWGGDGTGTDGADTFRIRIWTEDEATAVETDVYDNGFDQDLGGGSVVIHKPK